MNMLRSWGCYGETKHDFLDLYIMGCVLNMGDLTPQFMAIWGT